MVEEKKSIVHRIIPKLWSNISDMNVLQRLMGLQVSNLDDEGVRTMASASNNKLCHDNSIVCSSTQRSDPPLRSSQVWRVYSEIFILYVPCCCCFQSSHIRPVAEFSLSIASNYLVVEGGFEEFLALFWRTLVTKSYLELCKQESTMDHHGHYELRTCSHGDHMDRAR